MIMRMGCTIIIFLLLSIATVHSTFPWTTTQQNDEFLTLLEAKPPTGINIFSQYDSATKRVSDTRGREYDIVLEGSTTPTVVTHNPDITRLYPPSTSTVWTSQDTATLTATFTFTDKSYGNGDYTVRASSYYNSASYKPWMIFGYNTLGGLFKAYAYTNTNYGIYAGTASLDGTYRGDWITIEFPAPFVVTQFRFTPRGGSETAGMPGMFKVYGRNGGIGSWTLLYTQSQDPANIATNTVYYTTTTVAYSEYGLVVNQLRLHSTTLNFKYWNFWGNTLNGGAAKPVTSLYGAVGSTWTSPALATTYTLCWVARDNHVDTLVASDWTITCVTNGLTDPFTYVTDQVESVSTQQTMSATHPSSDNWVHSMYTWDIALTKSDMKSVTRALRKEIGGVPYAQTQPVVPILDIPAYYKRFQLVLQTPQNFDAFWASPAEYRIACAAGSYADSNTGDCIPCENKTYSTTVEATDSSTCLSCPENTHSEIGSSTLGSCTCLPGYNGMAGTECTACGVGTYTLATGSETCIGCEMGRYRTSEGPGTCSGCASNTYSQTTGATSPETCIDCPVNTVAGFGSAECVCAPGYTGPWTACTPCDPGTYKTASGTAACINCAAGSYKTTAGSGTCAYCPKDSYSLTGADSCTTCPALTTSVVGSNELTDCVCIQGYTGPNGGECTPCNVGTYKHVIGDTDCIDCAAGTWKNITGPGTCTFCGMNTYSLELTATSADTCIGCPGASVSGLGSTQCMCPSGYIGAWTSCAACNPDTYKPSQCMPGYFGNRILDFFATTPPRSVNIFEDWNGTHVPDRMGNGWDVELYSGDAPIVKTEVGYNAVHDIKSLYIASSTQMQWPVDSLPSTFTICMTMRATSVTGASPFGCRGSVSNVGTYKQMGIGGGSGWTYFSPSYRTGNSAYEPDETLWFTQCTSANQAGPDHTVWEHEPIGQTAMNNGGNCQLNFNMWTPSNIANLAVHSIFIWDRVFSIEEKKIVTAAQRAMLDNPGGSNEPPYSKSCVNTRLDNCTSCPTNSFSASGDSHCTCGEGFQDDQDGVPCNECVVGYTDDSDGVSCNACTTGYTREGGDISFIQ